jgi:hypothetical protein
VRKYLFKKNLSIPEIAHNLKIFKLRQQGGKRGGSGAVSDKESEEFHYAVTEPANCGQCHRTVIIFGEMVKTVLHRKV